MSVKKLTARIMTALAVIFGFSVSTLAEGRLGMPTKGGMWLQEAANEQARKIGDFNVDLMWIITVITVLVFLLMFYVMFRFRAKANPEPSKVSHNTVIEVIWTAVPIIILVVIGITSLPLLYYQDVVPETKFAIRVTGNQWNWTYNYPDHGGIEYTASVVPDSAFSNENERKDYEHDLSEFLGWDAKLNARLLDTDLRLVVPIKTKIKVMLTASDVIHAWALPSLGVKLDAVPGRLNETWFEVDEVGTYYGQCSELCGKDHAFMPIAVEAVSQEDFDKWVARAQADYADAATTALGR